MRPAKERARAPARRLEVLESFGRDEDEVDDDEEEEAVLVRVVGWERRAADWRMALSEVK